MILRACLTGSHCQVCFHALLKVRSCNEGKEMSDGFNVKSSLALLMAVLSVQVSRESIESGWTESQF